LAGGVITAQAIVRAAIAVGVEEEDQKETWMEDAESFVAKGAVNCARAVYGHALSVFTVDEELWLQAAFFEKDHGTPETLEEHLKKAVRYCPQAETLWLMGAKSAWLSGNVVGARNILAEAFKANSGSEEIWLAAIKLESENNEFDRARKLLERARLNAGTARVWVKSVRLEWVLGALDAAKAMLKDAIRVHPGYFKLYLMLGQILDQEGQTDEARQAYADGTKAVPAAIAIWRGAAALEVSQGRTAAQGEKWGQAASAGCWGCDWEGTPLQATLPRRGLCWSAHVQRTRKRQNCGWTLCALSVCQATSLLPMP
jgi:pre-mRNA-processing factor 6